MKKELLIGALLIGGALALQDVSIGHGGTYRGPGDTVPPGGGGGGGGGGPSTPGPSGPSTPGGSGPSTPGPATPGSPGGGGGGTQAPTTSGPSSNGPDLTNWQFWWGFNKDPYLNLRAKIHEGVTLTGSDEFFLGHGEQSEAKDSLRPSEQTIRQKIVPALKSALENERNNDILTGAMVALAKIGDAKDLEGDSEFESIIAGFLDDSVQEVRETAAVALGILANPKSIDTLEALAKDTADGRKLVGNEAEVHFRTRAFACYGLGLVGYQASAEDRAKIVDILAQIIAEDKLSTRDVKVAAIIAMGLAPIENMDSVPVEGEEKGKEIDPTRSRSDQIQYLLNFLEDDRGNHFLVRAHAPRSIALLLKDAPEALRERTGETLLQFVGRKAQSHQRELRESATLALGQVGNCDGDGVDAKIQEVLFEGMEDPDQQSKFFSLIALAQAAGRPGAKDAPNGPYDEKTLKEARKHLGTTMARGKTRAKAWAALSIGVLGHALNENKLMAQSSDLSSAIRSSMEKITNPLDVGAYALAAGMRRDQEAISMLKGKLEQISDDEARGHIAIGLGLMDAREAIQDIQEIVKKAKYRPDLLKQAAIALGLLGDKTTVPDLIEMLRDAKSLATQASIAQALGFIGDSRSVDPLVEMLGDSQITARARAFAAVALGIVADKEPLPWNSKISVDINYRANTSTLTSQSGTGLLDIL